MIKILIVFPYRELQDAFETEVKNYDLEDISVSYTHVFGSDPKVMEALEADIIVARGITASAIALNKPAVHVVPIALSSGDLLEALAQAKALVNPCHIGVVTNEQLCEQEHIATLVECPVSVVKVTDQDDVKSGVAFLRSQGCTVFVGGLTMCRHCEAMGLPFVHVKTGYQAVIHSVGEAVAAARSLDRAQTRGNLLGTLLNNASYALFAINSFGVIIAGNRQAENLFHAEHLENRHIDEIFRGSSWSQTVISGTPVEELVKLGSQNFLVNQQPINVDKQTYGVLFTFQNAEMIRQSEHKIRTELSRKGLVARYSFSDIVTQDSRMLDLVEKAKRFSQVPGAILVLGETGTGKELFAQSIHNASPRAKQPFVAVNCAALPEHLLESELFGYTEGAFTGASKGGKVGLFELAHKGTLFLDEIGEMPIVVQAKLLRVLQEREVRKVGADMVVPVDVRVISAANSNIIQKVKEGTFRLDLFYRISLLSLQLMPLRERLDDVILLFRHFVQQYCSRHNLNAIEVSNEAAKVLKKFYWPGNIRELRNAAERLAILHTSSFVGVDEIEQLDIGSTSLYLQSNSPPSRTVSVGHGSDEDLYRRFKASGLSREAFAHQMGMSRTTLWRKLSRYIAEE